MTREEIVKAVTEPESITDTEKKTVVISSSSKADFAKIAKSHNLEQGTKQYQIIRGRSKFCVS